MLAGIASAYSLKNSVLLDYSAFKKLAKLMEQESKRYRLLEMDVREAMRWYNRFLIENVIKGTMSFVNDLSYALLRMLASMLKLGRRGR